MPAPEEILVEVAVPLPVHGTFTYRVPEGMGEDATAGVRVLVPFGRRRVTGYVLGVGADPGRVKIKTLVDVLDPGPIFPAGMIAFLRWTAEYYKHPLGEVIQTALPGGLTVAEHAVCSLTAEGRKALEGEAVGSVARDVLALLAQGGLRARDLHRRLGRVVPRAALAALERRGLIRREAQLLGGAARPLEERWVRAKAGNGGLGKPLSAKKALILETLAAAGPMRLRTLAERIPHAGAHVRALAQDGRVEVFGRRVYRDPLGAPVAPDTPPALNAAQQAAVAAVCASFGQGFRPLLLNGVTGSGKTEVYLQVAAEAMSSRRSALVLVPEIALLTEIERRFRARFGEGIAVLHSGLSEGERYDQWSRILQQDATIAIGARSAVFAPFARLGVVIVDEEHDTSYKQEGSLHYNARDLAVVRASQDGCPVLLGSATPSLQSTYNVRSGKYAELRLPERVEQRALPEIRVVDLRQSRDLRGPGRFISPELHRAMGDTLARGEQALLFLNRRGFASYPVCAACGSALRCRHCDITLTLHQAADAYRCHFCGYSRPAASGCEACGSAKIKRLGLGTEKVEQAVAALFPGARVARMDRDTTQRKGAVRSLLKKLREGGIDVLVGTQMVAKGHDFPGITLVGIVCADLSLSFPDFRAGERTFQLLAQVAGRAGRGERPGLVILQTYNPEHFSIRTARDQDYDAFYAQEIEFRRALGYPPVTRMVQLKISGPDSRQTRQLAEALGRQCQILRSSGAGGGGAVDIMGPVEAAVPRIAGQHRWQILLKAVQPAVLHRFLDRLMADRPPGLDGRPARLAVDVDPLFIM
jgi:primosomal protein N' (replication factor Y)